MDERIQELKQICKENPITIPVPIAAAFLHMKPENLRFALEQNRCPFGLGWKKGANRGFSIQTLPFWLWYTGGKVDFDNHITTTQSHK